MEPHEQVQASRLAAPDDFATGVAHEWTAPPQLLAARQLMGGLPWRDRLRVLLGRPVQVPGDTTMTVPPGAGSITITAYGGGGYGGGGAGGGGVPLRPGPQADDDWPGQRSCCPSTIGGRHQIGCVEVLEYRARACCASVPGQAHTPSCPTTYAMREAMTDHEALNAPPAPVTHAHAYDQVCTMACPLYAGAEHTMTISGPVTPTVGGTVRGCCGTASGTGHLASCDGAGG